MADDKLIFVSSEEMYFTVAMLALFSVCGSAGNALVLYVFSTAKDNLVSTLFIIVLAVVDFCTCVVIIPFTIVVEVILYNVRFDFVCKLYQFLITSNIPFSALIMTAIAVDRYLCICHPFARLLTLQRARVVVVILAVFACTLGIVGALTHSVYQLVITTTNSTQYNTSTQLTLTTTVSWKNYSETVYTGHCKPSDLILDNRSASLFQKCHTAVFVVCLGIVVILYSLIYRSVLRQRHKRQKMKATPIITCTSSVQRTARQSLTDKTSGLSSSKQPKASAGPPCGNENGGIARIEASSEAMDSVSEKRSGAGLVNPTAEAAEAVRRNRIANIKTAAMLSIVTLVFAVSFMPSLAMTVYILPYNITIFYMYFTNNVANPVIYSFMNSTFRKRLVGLFGK